MTEGIKSPKKTISMNESKDLQISIVVPAFNEEYRLSGTLPTLWNSCQKIFKSFEIIIVSDGSSDQTGTIVTNFSRRHPEVCLLHYSPNRGKGFAVKTGVLAAQGELILISDADLSTPLEDVGKLIEAIKGGADIAIGSRSTKGSEILLSQPFYRVFMGKTYNKIVRLLTVRGFNDTQCGFKCFTRNAVKQIFPDSIIPGFSFDVEILFIALHRGLKVKEIGVHWENSPESRVHPIRHSLQMLKELFLIRINAWLGRYG